MAVLFDATAQVGGVAVTTLTTAAFTISGSNRAAMIGMSWDNGGGVTGISTTCGGVTGAAIANTDITNFVRTAMFQVIAPATGSQTANCAWTNARDAVLGVVTATGVGQTTPFNNGATESAASGTPSLAITSTNGDLTIDTLDEQDTPSGPNQTERWNTVRGGAGGAGSTGPGTGTATHSWASTAASYSHSGANFVQAAAADTLFAGSIM